MRAFTKGQKVTVREGAKSLTGQPPNSAVRTVAHPEYHDLEHPGDWVYLEDDTGDYAVGHIFLAADVTPAPLDPSKVRVQKQVRWATDLKRGDVIVSVEAHNAVTVEREESAPEPEPEWADGTVAEVTYNNAEETEQFKTRALRGNDSWVPFADVSDLIMDDEVTDVRPLVVVDPAAAREKIAEGVRTKLGGPLDAWYDVSDVVMTALGIEAS